MNWNNDSSIVLISTIDSEFSRLLKLSIFISIDIISIPLSIIILYHLYRKRSQRRSLSDTIIILLIIISLIDIIFQQSGILIFFRLSTVYFQSNIYCLIWNYINYLDYYLNLYLTVWASFERHILIFHRNRFNTKKKRFIFHICPLIFIFIYGIFVYIGLIFANSCLNNFNMNQPWCGGVCFINNRFQYLYDWLINAVLPICLIIILNIILVIRVVCQKNRLKQSRSTWKKCRKLTIQMISISSIYIICFFPSGIIAVIRTLFGDPNFGAMALLTCFQYTFLFANVLLPFVTINLLPDLKKQIKQKFKRIIPLSSRIRTVKVTPMITYVPDPRQL